MISAKFQYKADWVQERHNCFNYTEVYLDDEQLHFAASKNHSIVWHSRRSHRKIPFKAYFRNKNPHQIEYIFNYRVQTPWFPNITFKYTHIPFQCIHYFITFILSCDVTRSPAPISHIRTSTHTRTARINMPGCFPTLQCQKLPLSIMINQLPLEIQVRLLKLVPHSLLKFINSHFYLLYNDLFFDKLVRVFGDDALVLLAKVYPRLRTYIKSLDTFRETSRKVISSRRGLKDLALTTGSEKAISADDISQAQYIGDSWRYVYSLFKNKRMFAEYSDYKIDEPTNYVYNHYLEINRTYLLSYCKTAWLAPGKYNLNIGLVVKHGNGLGTTKFEIKYRNIHGEDTVLTFYPPTNIKDILPKNQFCFLKIGEFEIPALPQDGVMDSDSHHHHHLYKIQLTMEEIGLYVKSGFSIFFIDISLPSMIFNDYDLLYYSCQETNYEYFINLPLKNLYKALNHVQNGGDDSYESTKPYGEGDPEEIEEEYAQDYELDNHLKFASSDENLLAYADFFFKNTFNKRRFKFNTVYQRRQFVNRFGEFDPEDSEDESRNPCLYDIEGLKWRIPILGEL